MQAVIQECKAFKPLAAKQNANLVNGFYYTVEDSQPTKNADGQWTAKRSITKKPRTTASETNIRKTLEDLVVSDIFIVSSKRFENLCSGGFLACHSLDLQ